MGASLAVMAAALLLAPATASATTSCTYTGASVRSPAGRPPRRRPAEVGHLGDRDRGQQRQHRPVLLRRQSDALEHQDDLGGQPDRRDAEHRRDRRARSLRRRRDRDVREPARRPRLGAVRGRHGGGRREHPVRVQRHRSKHQRRGSGSDPHPQRRAAPRVLRRPRPRPNHRPGRVPNRRTAHGSRSPAGRCRDRQPRRRRRRRHHQRRRRQRHHLRQRGQRHHRPRRGRRRTGRRRRRHRRALVPGQSRGRSGRLGAVQRTPEHGP